MKLSCDICRGICCYTPPQLKNKNEYDIAVRNNAKKYIRAFKQSNGKYVLMLIKKNGKCPFLDNGKCKIYNERFEVCRLYKCRDFEKDIKEPYTLDEFGKNLEEVKKPENTIFEVSKSFIRKENIKVIDFIGLMEKVLLVDSYIVEQKVKSLNERLFFGKGANDKES